MAGAQCANISFVPPSGDACRARRKPVLLLSSISTSLPSKLTRRKNFLRQKLLKTVTKPYPNRLLPESTPTNLVSPSECQHDQQPESQSDQIVGEEIKESDTQDFRISKTSEAVGAFNGHFDNFSTRSLLKWGLYFVGAFVFQTICAVWVFGSAGSEHKDGKLDTGGEIRVSELGVNGNNKAKLNVWLDGNGTLSSGKFGVKQGYELEEKIVEIQAMARDARESERLDSKLNGSDNDEFVRTGIGKEVDSKLVKLQKMLKTRRFSPVFPVSYLGKEDKVEDGIDGDTLDSKDANKPLVFKKKYKFRTPLANLSDKPKGFRGSEDRGVTRSRNNSSAIEDEPVVNGNVDNDSAGLLDEEQKTVQFNGNPHVGGVSLPSEEDSEGKPSQKRSKSFRTTTKLGNGRARKTNQRKQNGVAKPEPGIGKVEGKQSDEKADFWWLSLPYVLAIVMHRGHDSHGPKGLFALKRSPHAKNQGDLSHTVAFEDHGDATNFCYLLQSFFEDLGDFNADIVPLSIKEVEEEVRSHTMKVIVVKKGQLELYAGQPLAEVETALRSLI